MSIDFGTSSSAAAMIRNNKPELAPPLDADAAGSRIFPSVAYVKENGNIVACHDAERMKNFDASRFLREFKLDMHDGSVPDLGASYIRVVSAVLTVLKRAAEQSLGEPIENLVLTVPATCHSDDPKYKVMLAAASNAGFVKTEIIKEAQAAAIYYDFVEQNPTGYSLVYDLGGGTFDAAIVHHNGKDYRLVGNSAGLDIGGKFFTEKILDDYIAKTGIEPDYSNPAQLEAIIAKCENIKRHLTNHAEGVFPVSPEKTYSLARKEFENMISADLKKTFDVCDTLVNDVRLKWSDVSRILLIGGSCHIPLVHERMKSHLESHSVTNAHIVWKRTESDREIEPQFAVALGAAVYIIKKITPPPPPPPPSIGVLKNKMTGEIYHLKEGENTFGRSSKVDFSFPDHATMSGRHFSIKVIIKDNNCEYQITDLDSSHGTIVDQMVLENKYSYSQKTIFLKGGERITAGSIKFEFLT